MLLISGSPRRKRRRARTPTTASAAMPRGGGSQIRSAQLARSSDGPGGGSRLGACRIRSTAGSALWAGPTAATSVGADTGATLRSVFCAGAAGTAAVLQHCETSFANVAEDGGAFLGQQHDMRTVSPQRMNKRPCAAPEARSAGASRMAMRLLCRRARIPRDYADSVPESQRKCRPARETGDSPEVRAAWCNRCASRRSNTSPRAPLEAPGVATHLHRFGRRRFTCNDRLDFSDAGKLEAGAARGAREADRAA